jgi:DNA modification methylase
MIDLRCGDCRELLMTLADASVDVVVCDPPYPCVDRSYGKLSEDQWSDLMHEVVRQCRRILRQRGSAVIILQPNSRKVGSMRGWLWRFLAWCCEEWNVVQDHYWWNHATPPTVHCQRRIGLMRPSVKYCVWLGEPDCRRNQDEILWNESLSNAAKRKQSDALRVHPSGLSMRAKRCGTAALVRGGSTPFNLLPLANSDSVTSAGAAGHGAGTPRRLAEYWIRYLSAPDDTVLDPFCGVGTIPLEAVRLGRRAIGFETARRRLASITPGLPLVESAS